MIQIEDLKKVLTAMRQDPKTGKNTDEQIQCILELGELLLALPYAERPLRLTLMAVQLARNGVAQSQEEAHVMLMEAYAHAANMQLIRWYDDMILKLGTKEVA